MKRIKQLLKLSVVLCLLIANTTFAQETPSKEVREKLQELYNQIKRPEIPFEKFLQLNAHIYNNQTNLVNKAAVASAAALPQDTYCGKVRPYCSNSDFESGLDQNQYTGAYGLWSTDLYPNPFGLTYGFLSGVLSSSAAHQTIVNKSAGVDPIAGIPVVPSNGGNQSLRLGNSAIGLGTEIIAKTVTVDANESVLGFYYAVVLQDPGHDHEDQPAFSVRAYDCATGLELPNVCDLGNGSNIAVADANNPFFQNKVYQSELLVYRDWSKVQINLSKYVGKNVIIVFTSKDCNLSGHFGYAYIDNLFSTNCPAAPEPPKPGTDPGDVSLNIVNTSTCGAGKICAKYKLPTLVPTSGPTTYGNIIISLDIYQNNSLVKTVTSPLITTYPSDSTYCFSIDPATLGINTGVGGFDYTLTGRFTISGSPLSPVIVGNPGTGVKSGTNNDYLISCDGTTPQPPTSVTCPASTTVIADPTTCMAKVSWTIPTKMFPDSISISNGTLVYKGTYNGHGYYQSTGIYKWQDAKNAAGSIGSHLVTITDAAENAFITSNLDQTNNFAWIGLYNTGAVGSFAWVTGEPLSYTNWLPGEPNNYYGNRSDITVFEPYVQINGWYDNTNRWNDIGDSASIFIAEFDNAVISYKQISGPVNGDMQAPGVYKICYEISNSATGTKDTCCFEITVVCNSITSTCPKDTTIIADPNTCKAKVTWTAPAKMFPDSISIGLAGGTLVYKGIYNGHGYYQSTTKHTWQNARVASSTAGGHLVTITDAAENAFVSTNLNQTGNYAWIGLYNTGKAGSFAWVNGEPLSYTNWLPGEPNNYYGNPNDVTIFEPYVQINGWYDNTNRWNDFGDSASIFIAEFDSPVITYKQISGPANGDSLAPGVYTICYEISNMSTLKKDTCCFHITVVCNAGPALARAVSASARQTGETGLHIFNAMAYPNPTTSNFVVKVNSDNVTEKISMKVVDIAGRTVEMKNVLTPGSTFNFGSKYAPGIYFTTITQGSKVIVMKLVKQ